jgi:hypothetical protein
MLIANDVRNNEFSSHMDNHLKSKLATHSTHLVCYLRRHILALEYFQWLTYVETIQNIYPFVGLVDKRRMLHIQAR